MNRIDAIKSIARNLKDLIADTYISFAGTLLADASKLVHPIENQLQGRDFYIYSGLGSGQERTITGFSPENNRLWFSESLTTIPTLTSKFVVFDYFTKDDFDNAIDRMLGIAELKYLEEKVATMAIVGTQFEYPVPTGFEYITTLRLVPSGSSYSDYEAEDYTDRIFELPPRLWRIESNPLGTICIIFDSRKISLDDYHNYNVRVIGQVKPSVLATDTGTLPEALEEYIIAGASMILSSMRMDEKQEWKAKFYMFRDMTRELEVYITRNPRGVRVG